MTKLLCYFWKWIGLTGKMILEVFECGVCSWYIGGWAAKGKFFLSAQDNHLVSKTIEEEMGEILRSEFPRKINKREKTSR